MKMNNLTTRFVQRRAMSKIIAILAASMLLASPGLNSAMAASDDSNLHYLGLDESMAKPIGDAEMGQMRGRFVPPGGGSQVLYFGLVMQSSVADQNGNALSAGLAFGVNFKTGTPNIVTNLTWATQTGTGASGSGAPGASGGTPLGNITGGVGQVIQIAGSGNQGLNQASIDVTHSTPGALMPDGVPTGTPCGSSCQTSIQNNALQVSVNMPGSSASQTIGSSVILQGIKLNGDMAQAANSMNMVIQLAQPSGLNTLGISTVLQTIPTLPR
jgi:hypothetical protein